MMTAKCFGLSNQCDLRQ